MQLLANGKQQFIDGNGAPLANGQVYFYAPGTTTPSTTYQDSAGLIPNTNPVVLDSNGQAVIWGNGTYRQVVLNASSVMVWDQTVSVPDLNAPLASLAGAAGSALIGFKQSGTGSITRLVQDKGREIFSLKDFGAAGDGITDDTAAIQRTFDAIKALGGGAIYAPAGTYLVSSAIVITNSSNILFYGAGNDATIIKSTSTTADVFYDAGTSFWRTFRDFSISSSVTKTAGSSFNLAGERRGLFDRIRITGHFNGFNFAGFEQTELRSCSITKPSGAGASIIAGIVGSAGQGANLLINSCFLRGNDDITQNAPTGNYGLVIYDVDAVFGQNTDIGAYILNDMLIAPSTRSANHFFTQCFFDATKSSNCVTMQGAGTKQQITFVGGWMASAGKLAGGSAEVCGLRATNNGAYQDIQLIGVKFYNCNGSGALLECPAADFNFTGCDFSSNGATATTNRYGFFYTPTTTGTLGPMLSGCRFGSNTPNDARFDTNSRVYSVTGCNFQTGVANAGANGVFSGNVDNTITSVASASTIAISPNQSLVNITGTTNIGGITATFLGHIVQIKFAAALTVVNNSQNLRLAGNFTAAAGQTLTLMCDGSEWREIGRALVV